MTSETKDRKTWLERPAVAIVNMTLLVTGIVNLVAGTAYSVAGSTAPGAACLTAGLILLLFATVDRFELIKGLGMEAKVRDLRRTIGEADKVIEQLRDLTEYFGEAALISATSAGRWDSAPSIQQTHVQAMGLARRMKELGSSPERIREALKSWIRMAAIDWVAAVAPPWSEELQRVATRLTWESNIDGLAPAKVEELRTRAADLRTMAGTLVERLAAIPAIGLVEAFQAEIAKAPEAAAAEVAKLRDVVDSWGPEMRQLAETGALRTPERWYSLRDHEESSLSD